MCFFSIIRQSKREYEMEEKKRKTVEKEELESMMVLEQNRLQNEKIKEKQKYDQVLVIKVKDLLLEITKKY